MGKAVPNLQLFLVLVLISLALILIDSTPILTLPKSAAYFITNPISFGLYKTKQSLDRQFHFIFAARFAGQENKALQEQLGEILSENAQLKRRLAEAEAQLLQNQHLDPRTYNLLPARPIGLERFLKIDKGRKDGVRVGQAVVFKDNYIGRIESISEGGASIKLLIDPDSKISAFSFGKEDKGKGVVVGQFGLELLMDKILHEERVEIGDLVYSEGTEGFLPRGLILGRVTEILERENEVFKQAKVVPVFDIRDLELVFIMQ